MRATAIVGSSHYYLPIDEKRTSSTHFSSGFRVLASGKVSSFFTLTNKPIWSVSEVAEAVNGKIVKWGPSGTVTTDTRTMMSPDSSTNSSSVGQWFFAINGPNFDGHDFINTDLYNKGCVGVIGHRVCENWKKGFVKLEEKDSSLVSLEKMGSYARRKFDGNVVGVTGSVGKTTTRTMIALALESLGCVHQTYENQNNVIGVALTLIGIPGNAEVSVLELGMSRKGEILELARMCRPSVRVILNVGPSHLEYFQSLDEIASTKGEILTEAKPGDVCILNGDDPLVMNLPVPHGVKKVLFGQSLGCHIRLVLAETVDGGHGVRVVLEKNTELAEFVISSPGLHLALNACAAAAVAVVLGVSLPQVAKSLSRFVPVHMRSELEIAENGIRIINDVYNASPISTIAAINLLKAIDCRGSRVAILGDMLELGPTEIEAHETVLSLCCEYEDHITLVALVGRRFITAAENLNLVGRINVLCALDAESLAHEVTERLTSNDVVLVKGSRGVRMEKLVNAIKAIHMGNSFESYIFLALQFFIFFLYYFQVVSYASRRCVITFLVFCSSNAKCRNTNKKHLHDKRKTEYGALLTILQLENRRGIEKSRQMC